MKEQVLFDAGDPFLAIIKPRVCDFSKMSPSSQIYSSLIEHLQLVSTSPKSSSTHLKDVSCEAFNSVVDGQDMDALAILNVWTRLDGHDVTQADAKVVSDLCSGGEEKGVGVSGCISFTLDLHTFIHACTTIHM